MEVRILGDSIVLVQPSGYANWDDMKNAVDFTIRAIEESIPDNKSYIHIADYTLVSGVSYSGRKHFIDSVKKRQRLLALIFCGLSPFMSLSVKLGKRLHIFRFKVFITPNYEEAAKLAVSLLKSHQSTEEANEIQLQSVQDSEENKPVKIHSLKIITGPEWQLQLDGFSTVFEVIDDKILHSVSTGLLQERHVDNLTKLRKKVKEEKGTPVEFDYIVACVKELKGGSRKARRRYINALKDWHMVEPFRIYIFYGANRFMRAASNLARPFLPFKVRVAQDLNEALQIIEEDQKQDHHIPYARQIEAGKEELSTGHPIQFYVDEILHYLGSINWDLNGLNVEPHIDGSHPFYQVFEAIRLIKGELDDLLNEQKQAEKALREGEEKYRTTLEANPDPMVVYDMEGKVVYFNPAFTRVFGWRLEECIGKKMDMFVPEKNWPETRMMIDKILTGESFSGVETERKTKDGHVIQVSISAAIYHDREGKPAGNVINLRDISVQKRLESQLVQAKKMEAIGTLAGGVAHDLNNVLSGIVSFPDLLLMQISEDSPLRKPIRTIQESGQKAAAIVQDLLTLARRGVATAEVINLNKVISTYLRSPEFETLKSFYPEIEVESQIETGLLNILGSPVHLAKTLMNLVSNAAEAMPGGGKITISTENRYIDGPINGYDEVKEGDYVVLIVSDTGVGISSEERERIFEPFYTKKVMGKSGTGLGMAVVWGTVKDHNGYIDIKSAEGKGTTFSLYFPVTRKELARDDDLLSIDEYKGKGEKILVIDDVESQREIASMILSQLEYSPIAVSSGEEAVEYVKNNKIDLLLLDMIMDPGMDGLDTYRKILEIRPNQKAIIASGFSETERVKEVQRLGAGQYLKKPYTLEKIGIAVRNELDK